MSIPIRSNLNLKYTLETTTRGWIIKTIKVKQRQKLIIKIYYNFYSIFKDNKARIEGAQLHSAAQNARIYKIKRKNIKSLRF